MITSKKGGLFIWFGVLIVLFAVGLVYLMLTPAFDGVSESIHPLMNGTHEDTYQKINNVWDNWPIFSILVLFIAGFILMANQGSSPF